MPPHENSEQDPTYRVLIVDDNPAIHTDFQKILGASPSTNSRLENAEAALFGEGEPTLPVTRFVLDSAYQGQESLEKVRQAIREGNPYSIAFMDIRMPPGWDGIETTARIWEIDPTLQVVICTAYSDYSWEGMRARLGPSDSAVILKKPFDNIEAIQLAHALGRKWHLAREMNRRISKLESQLREAQSSAALVCGLPPAGPGTGVGDEGHFAALFYASPIPMAILDGARRQFKEINASFSRLTGYTDLELIGQTPAEIGLWNSPENDPRSQAALRLEPRPTQDGLRTKSGAFQPCLIRIEETDCHGQQLTLIFVEGGPTTVLRSGAYAA